VSELHVHVGVTCFVDLLIFPQFLGLHGARRVRQKIAGKSTNQQKDTGARASVAVALRKKTA
jgi:hypothetical protein